MRPQVGQVINNKYRLIRIIGDGGMGSVYESRHELLSTTVALKFLHPELSKRSGLVQRFLQEARVSAQIQSPHVVRVIDVDQQAGGLAYIVMEYLEGKTLQTLYEDLYKAGQRLSYPDAIEYAMQMLEGVEAAHATGIVHRDLKPDNVIITKDKRGEPLLKLLDFGIAKLKVTGVMDRGLTRPGVVMGTPEYMAPEQAYSADAVDNAADIFSLGVMIFEMLAGRRPVGGDDPHQIATAYMTGQISKLTDLAPGISPELAAVVHKAMAPQPKDRFQSVAEFRSALEPFVRMVKGGSLTTPATPMPGNVTPSAMPAMSAVASPAPLTPSTPATNAPDDPENRAVPKTIPPDEPSDQASMVGAGPRPDATVEAAPLAADATPGTAPGGFVVNQGADGRASLNDRSSSPALAPNGLSPAMPSTVNAAPYMPGASGAGPAYGAGVPATVSAPPFVPPNAGGYPATSFDSPAFDAQARPGGTAVGASPFNGTAPAYPIVSHGTQAGMPGTAPMDPLYMPPQPNTAGKKAGSKGPSILGILLIAAGISGLVVGGLYVGQRILKPSEGDGGASAISSVPTPIPVTADPGPTTPPSSEPIPASMPTAPISQGPTRPTATPPKSTSTWTGSSPKPPVTTPTTSSTPTQTTPAIPPPMLPTSFPPIVIPTSIFPGPSLPRPTVPTQTQPTQPSLPPKPSATTPPTQPSTSSTRPRIHVPKGP